MSAAGLVSVKLTVLEVLALLAATVVGANTADRGLAPAVVSAVVARVAIPELTVTGAPIATPPLLKVTVPAAAAGETVAVRITLAPEGAVVTAVPGADANAADSVVLVVACVTVTVFAGEV